MCSMPPRGYSALPGRLGRRCAPSARLEQDQTCRACGECWGKLFSKRRTHGNNILLAYAGNIQRLLPSPGHFPRTAFPYNRSWPAPLPGRRQLRRRPGRRRPGGQLEDRFHGPRRPDGAIIAAIGASWASTRAGASTSRRGPSRRGSCHFHVIAAIFAGFPLFPGVEDFIA